MTGFAHVFGDAMVEPRRTGLSFPFFIKQAFAITLEDAVIAAGKRLGIRESWVTRLVGYAWTISWFTYTASMWVDPMIELGICSHRVFPSSLVQPLLRNVAEKTGIDVLGWVAQQFAL